MLNCSELADYEWLTGPQAGVLLEDLAGRREPLHTAATRLRREFSTSRVHLLLEQVALRERAAVKFEHSGRIFFTRLGLEQATDQWVAGYKARRFADQGPVADLCCGIGGDLLALAAHASTLGIDRDPVATHLAEANAQATLDREAARHVRFATAEVTPASVTDSATWHLDPDRRPIGRRTSSIDGSSPNRCVVEQLLSVNPHAAVKLAPAAVVPTEWAEVCELEWIGRDRQCRQLVAWHGDLAQVPGKRRATILTNDGKVARTLQGHPDERIPVAGSIEQFLFEPDAAVVAAHLAQTVAAEHGLSAVSPGIAYLTGPEVVHDAALACFAVEDVLPLDLARLAGHLRARNCGTLEIKVRGVEYDPEQVRRQLKLRGERAATLILTKLSRKRFAILARRIGNECSLSPDPCILTPHHAACL